MIGIARGDRLAHPEQEPGKECVIRFFIRPIGAFLMVNDCRDIRDGIGDFCNRSFGHIATRPGIGSFHGNRNLSGIGRNGGRLQGIKSLAVFCLEETAANDVGSCHPRHRNFSFGLDGFLAIDAKFRCPQRQVVAPGRFGKGRVAQHGQLGIAALKFHSIGVDQVAGKGAFHGTLLFFRNGVQGLGHAALNHIFGLCIK